MIKKLLFQLIILFLVINLNIKCLGTSINSQINQIKKEISKIDKTNKYIPSYSLQIGPAIGIFHSHDNLYRNIHNEATLTYILQIQLRMKALVAIWSDIGFFMNDGKMQNTHEVTGQFHDIDIYHLTCGLGLKMHSNINKHFNVFAKLGPNIMAIWCKRNYIYLPKTTEKICIGATTGCGFEGLIKNNWYMNIFVDYLYNRKSFDMAVETRQVNIGGILCGIGLNYKF